jgi:hypothetical protein
VRIARVRIAVITIIIAYPARTLPFAYRINKRTNTAVIINRY